MWEIILYVAVAFASGWTFRKLIDRKERSQQAEEPEMMWFNSEKSQWERVTDMQLCVGSRVIVTVPVKLIKERENNES